ncbi:MAG: GIY-YIG nuclease family protein [Alphaproteobacteria bacterium]
MYFVYFLRSESNPKKPYTGYTNNLTRRLREHNEGRAEKSYTLRFRPWRIEAFVYVDTEATAMIVEAYFKNASGKEKFRNFAIKNPHHPNPKQGFFDTAREGRAFGSGENRFWVSKENERTVITKKRP